MIKLYGGDNIAVMKGLPDNSIDTIITDPPYGLGFMGKEWDTFKNEHIKSGLKSDRESYEHRKNKTFNHKALGSPTQIHSPAAIAGSYDHSRNAEFQQWFTVWAKEVLRIAKPGAMMLVFGGTRTFHRLTCAIEDAGWEIRDCMMWLYGSGFPKSHNISKQLDLQEKNKWLNISKAIDNPAKMAILEAWKEYSKTVRLAEILSQKSETGVGIVTPKKDSVPAIVLLSINPEKSNANAIIAELKSKEALRLCEGNTPIVPTNAAESDFTSLVESAENKQSTPSIVQCHAKGLLNENITETIKVEEALMIWLGKTKSSKKQDTVALCVALTENLKLIILNQSKIFQNLDTIQKTEIVSATTVIITESTAANLISFMADTLKRKAIDKAKGAEREVVGIRHTRTANEKYGNGKGTNLQTLETMPNSDLAKQWHGYGTALKPAWEPIIVAMKPLDGTFAHNAEKWGVGGLWIDGGRIGLNGQNKTSGGCKGTKSKRVGYAVENPVKEDNSQGRWPANVILDEEAGIMLDEQSGVSKSTDRVRKNNRGWGDGIKYGKGNAQDSFGFADSGGASRFFYCAKASRSERNAGLEGMEKKQMYKCDNSPNSLEIFGTTDGGRKPRANNHPTVKPLKLMEYLCRLTRTPEGGSVLDPFGGSGTTALACMNTGRDCIIIEKEPAYCEIIRGRIKGNAAKKN